ncbi:hypothetical protein Tco_0992070 [Tanacetum coccineum]|uniref:Uncharacterized protein n=1 Tax=Tanacetum coccineum TaxID=301880 RepID=A0ABQ5F144_9ASTR
MECGVKQSQNQRDTDWHTTGDRQMQSCNTAHARASEGVCLRIIQPIGGASTEQSAREVTGVIQCCAGRAMRAAVDAHEREAGDQIRILATWE